MTASRRIAGAEDDHVEASLPWYLNGTLPAAESERVAAHLAACGQCRASAALEEQLVRHARERKEPVDLAPQFAWSRLAARIDAGAGLAGREQAGAEAGRAEGSEPRTGALRARMRATVGRRVVAAVLVAHAAAIVVLGIAVLQLSARDDARYSTVTDPVPARTPSGQALRLVIAPGTSNERFRSMLGHVGGSIHSGPSPGGVYTVEIQSGAGGTASREARDSAVRWLREQPEALLVEPVGAAQAP